MTRRRNLGVVGAVLVVAGAIALATSFTRHEACSSIIGQIAQGVSTRAQIMCGEYTAAFYAGIAGIIAGIVLVIVAWAIRPATPGRHASPFPAGWYLDEDDKNLRRWWDGEGWTDYTKPDRKPVWLHVVVIFVGIAVALAIVELVNWPFGSGATNAPRPTTAPVWPTLAPANVPPVVAECSIPLGIGADGNGGPLFCSNGGINTRAWHYFAGMRGAAVLGLGDHATPSAVLDTGCASATTWPIVTSDADLAARYYGWTFTVPSFDTSTCG